MKTYKITDVANVVLDKASGNTKIPYLEIGDIDVSTKQYCVKKKLAVEGALKAKKNHILISKVRPTRGAITILDDDYCVSNAFVVLEANNTVLPKYLFYSIAYNDKFYRYLGRLEKGTSYPSCRASDILFFKIPEKQKIEQAKIVKILDQADSLRQKRKEQLRLLDDYLKSVFLEMFGDPIRNGKRWRKKSLLEVCTKITDGTHDTPRRLEKGVKFITGKHIRPFKIDYENSDYVSEEDHIEIYKRCNPEKGDVLYTNIGVNAGTAAMNIVEYPFSMKNVALLKLNTDYNHPRYVEALLNYLPYKSEILRKASLGGAQQFLSLQDIKKITIFLPPIGLQNKFASIVEQVEQTKQKMRESLDEMDNHFNALMQRYFG